MQLLKQVKKLVREGASLAVIARALGVDEQWLGYVIHSDAFQVVE